MTRKERLVIASVLLAIALLVGMDLITDLQQGVALWHALMEGMIALSALFGVGYILRGSVKLKHRLEKEIHDFSEFRLEAEAWRSQAKKYIEGLSVAIDQQLTRWNLSAAEKEVAFLLLKGMSLKEIAQVRGTTEKTARVQSTAVYSKSGLAGRSELSAFFLEDLLAPHETQSNPHTRRENTP